MPDSKLPSTNQISTALSTDKEVIESSAATAAKENAAIVGADVSTKPAAEEPVGDKGAKDLDSTAERIEIDDSKPFDFNEFLAAKDEPLIKEEPKKEVKKEEAKVETKKEVAPVTAKPEAKKIPTTTERDLTGFEENEQKVLRAMSNEAFDYIRPRLLENKKLGEVVRKKDEEIANLKVGKQIMPESYYEHPEAFVLSPEYNTNIQLLNVAERIAQHWKAQFANIRKGEDWTDIDIDIKTGRLVFGKPQKATAEAEAEVMDFMSHASQQIQNFQGKVHNIRNSFKEKHAKDVSVLKEAEDKHFAAYKDPKHPYAPVMKTIEENIPASLRNSPLAPFVVKASTAVIQLGNIIKAKDEEIAKLKAGGATAINLKTEADKSAAGPTEADTTVTTSNSKDTKPNDDIVYDDFLKVKDRD